MGRRLLLTKANKNVAKKVATYVAAGATFKDACLAAGVSESSGYRWLDMGEKAAAKIEKDPEAELGKDESLYLEFWELLQVAEAQSVVQATMQLKMAGQTDWRAAESFLKRRRPAEWGDRRTEEAPTDVTVNTLIVNIAASVAEKMREALPQAGAIDAEVIDPDKGVDFE